MLSDKQLRAVDLVAMQSLNGLTYNQIAEEVGVNRTTLHKWRNTEEFRNKVINKAKQMNLDYMPIALDRLQKLINSSNESIQLKAIELFIKSQRYLATEDNQQEQPQRTVEEILAKYGL